MTDLTVTLTGDTAEKVRKLMAEQDYARPEDAIADAIAALEEAHDPELDAWLRDVAVKRAEANEADPSRNMTPDEVRASLARK